VTAGPSNYLFPSLSNYAANLHSVRTRLRRLTASSRSQVLVVVSALPHEGKSTFACNFAVAAACAGTRTLLIDGDVFNASASHAFGTKGPGLCEVSSRKVPFWSAITKHLNGRLHVLGACDTNGVAAEHPDVEERAFADLLRECRSHFDLIIIDSPAILSSVGASLPFVDCADHALMVVEWERTERHAVSEALGTLAAHANKVAGIVLNKVPVEWHRLFDSGRYANYGYSKREGSNLPAVCEEAPLAPKRHDLQQPLQAYTPSQEHRSGDQLFRL
jgi:capsular exopolysaccharide synthesis family protein